MTYQTNGRRWLTMAAAVATIATALVVAAEPAAAGRQYGCDFNNDGLGDLLVSAPNEDWRNADDVLLESAGRIDMLLGGANRQLRPNTDFTWLGSSSDYQLGRSVLCADFNADGYTDVVMGIPFFDGMAANNRQLTNSGAVAVFYGSAFGYGAEVDFITQDSPGISDAEEDNDTFGTELERGDFNDDGYPDLVVSAPGESIGNIEEAGMVHVIFGGPAGLEARDTVLHQNSPGIKGRANRLDNFGESLAANDFDGDGFWDLAVGVPREDVKGHANAGAINVIFGNGNGFSRRDQYLHRDLPHIQGQAQDGDFFGAPLWSADIVVAGLPRRWDLIVGVPAQDVDGQVDAGAVHILVGTISGLRGDRGGQVIHRNSPGIRDTATAYDNFGTSIATGFFDGDENLDLAIGVPGDDIPNALHSGAVHIIYGSGSEGRLSTRDREIHQNTRGVDETRERNDRFGFSIASVDLNGDGLSDLVVGAPLEDVRKRAGGRNFRNAGNLTVLWGRNAGMNGVGSVTINQDFFQHDGLLDGLNGVRKQENFGMLTQRLGCCGGFTAKTSGPVSASPPAGGGDAVVPGVR